MSVRRITIKIVLVSQDRALYELCRSTLRQFSIDGPALQAPGSKIGKADLTIWDISPGAGAPELKEDGNGSADLFVVSKASLAEVQKAARVSGFGFLLKPVTQPVLAAFLSAAVNRWAGSRDKGGNP